MIILFGVFGLDSIFIYFNLIVRRTEYDFDSCKSFCIRVCPREDYHTDIAVSYRS